MLQGSTTAKGSDSYHDLDALIGAWDQGNSGDFSAAVSPFEAIDPALWS